ncbi:Six-hairpin glycosidase [Leucogyrophana mollusca]|uniref:Six-hairpin glycosidase n=1 Tax=Leucogyrophana mollusca TaxID=85980 RepID=A0ACB8B2X3_9AGAM|nr:Six-hairpin glycosidase [Leucogyrophana mollusca]
MLVGKTSAGAIPSSGSVPNSQWSTLLGNRIYFHDAQRSGTLPSTNRVPWRNNSAVNDGHDVNLDLSGGYYDAGDYIKCTFPLSFTVLSICWGATDFGKGYDLANQTPYLDDMLRWSLDWLVKAHSSNNTLFVQIAEGTSIPPANIFPLIPAQRTSTTINHGIKDEVIRGSIKAQAASMET